jgi:signal transduction histidine kinase/NO-binding membrane sensor protein with MHYT domain/DNA-binding response OmpR family regulator
MNWYEHFFLVGQHPDNAMFGTYNPTLVVTSYVIAVLASYVALDMSSHLKKQTSALFRTCWWIGGALVMGAGIWSMHFIGMLAFRMSMPMSYSLVWTGASMLGATIAAGIAFLFFMLKKPTRVHYLLSGIILGAAILTMHYSGMAGMNNMVIHYTPGLFILSVLIAVIAATAALWLSVYSDRGSYKQRVKLKIVSALIMGIAIAGMHYTGMAAAVFTPSDTMVMGVTADPVTLSILITTIVLCIMCVAIIISTTKYYLTTKIQNERDFLEIVLDNLRDSVIAFDANKKIRLYNQASKNLFANIESLKNVSEDWDIKMPLYKNDKATRITAAEYPLEIIFKGKKIKGLEACIRNSADKSRTLSIDGQQLTGQEGENLGAVIVYQDITERKEIDQMKNEFISTVSHELRTPLTSIRGSLGLIIGGAMGAAPKEMQSLLQIASNNSERLVRLINDILDTEKIEAGKMVYHFAIGNISKLVEIAVVDNKSYADKYHVNYKINESIPDAVVMMDADRIRQVLDNLLSNAAKFSNPGNTVYVSIMLKERSIVIAVADTGRGIPEEFQSRIFSKFYQADSSDVREKGGTGLGLSICKSIIESHNGKIWFVSKPGLGTTFYVSLPSYNTIDLDKLQTHENFQNNKTILICEDDPDVSKLLGLILMQRGFDSVHVETIAEAKHALSKQQFCLMTLDLLLPDGNGLDLLQWIRANGKLINLPVVVISAISVEEQKVKGVALGVLDWMSKPIDENRLYKDVSLVLGGQNNNSKPKILHIEDDKDISNIVSRVLANICETEITDSVATAKKLLKKSKYDLVIIDINLTDGSGYQLISFLEDNNFRIPIVILSVDEANQSISKNIAASLVKSKISNQDLLDKIVAIIEATNKTNKDDRL